LKYRLHGNENRFSIGAYPEIGLKEARDIARGFRATYRTIAHEHLAIDPIVLELSLRRRRHLRLPGTAPVSAL